MKNINIILLFSIFSTFLFQCKEESNYEQLLRNGHYELYKDMIRQEIITQGDSIMPKKLDSLNFEIERLDRIERDFNKTDVEIQEYISKYVPDITLGEIDTLAQKRFLESKMINNQRKYFKYAAQNLFRIHPEYKKIRDLAEEKKYEGRKLTVGFPLNLHIEKVVKTARSKKSKYILPVVFKIRHTITVDSTAVPAGEIIRCWIPYPKEIPNRQYNIRRINSDPKKHMIPSKHKKMQRTVFFEKKAVKGEETTFFIEYEYTSKAMYVKIDPNKVVPVDKTNIDIQRYLKERPPHIVFNTELKELSKFIVKDETNPYRIAQKIFKWIDNNIPWASAREYSTIRNLSLYPFNEKHGDCGIKTFLFMTLCRINGIPTKWESGWEYKPPEDSMHDWCEAYFEPYGWVPVDVTYGMQDFKDDERKYFYLNGIDSYRLIFNDGYSYNFHPPKKFVRSETVDSQRGEVEWEQGNLYFDKWKWDFKWEIVSTYK